MDETGKTKIITVITICLVLFTSLLCGCYREEDSMTTYRYEGMTSEIIFSPITQNDFKNETKRNLLINDLAMSFPNVTTENDDIYIWYNNETYLAYNGLDHNKNLKLQYSKIDFLKKLSIIIYSEVDRHTKKLDRYYYTREEVEKKSANLMEEDIDFLKNQISRMTTILLTHYDTKIINGTFTPYIQES
jgi:hypothetical protein